MGHLHSSMRMLWKRKIQDTQKYLFIKNILKLEMRNFITIEYLEDKAFFLKVKQNNKDKENKKES